MKHIRSTSPAFFLKNAGLKMQSSYFMRVFLMASVKFIRLQEVRSTANAGISQNLFLVWYCWCIPKDIYIMLNFESSSKGSVPMKFWKKYEGRGGRAKKKISLEGYWEMCKLILVPMDSTKIQGFLMFTWLWVHLENKSLALDMFMYKIQINQVWLRRNSNVVHSLDSRSENES